MYPNRIPAICTALVLAPALAQAETHSFSLYAAGIKVGTIQINAQISADDYQLKSTARPIGLFESMSKFHYQGTTKGRITNNRLTPLQYMETTNVDDRRSEVTIQYQAGRPKILKYTSNVEGGIGPEDQQGALDLLTAAYILFRDSPPDQLCNQTIRMYDGKRATRLDIAKPKGAGPTICTGVYRRVAGFSEKSMRKGSNFPFTLTYTKLQNGQYRLQEFTAKTTVGTTTARRD